MDCHASSMTWPQYMSVIGSAQSCEQFFGGMYQVYYY
jgi:hypothetical protein